MVRYYNCVKEFVENKNIDQMFLFNAAKYDPTIAVSFGG